MSRYWFRPRRYGYGATPITWEGWAVTLGVVAVVLVSSLYLQLNAPRPGTLVTLVLVEAVAVAGLVVICHRKTDGEWRWRWGKDRE